MVGEDERMKGTSKIAKAFGALRPKSRNSAKQPTSLPSGSLPAPTLPNPSTTSTHPEGAKRSGDDDRTMSRYAAAAKGLKDVVENGRRSWEGFTPPAQAESIVENSSQLEEELEKILIQWKAASEDQGLWSSAKRLVKQIYIATSPFAKHVILVAKDAAQIPILNPYGLVAGGLMLLIAIADREVSRKDLIHKNVEYIGRQLGQLNVIDRLPDTDDQPKQLTNRATDVLSASLKYLTVHIRRDSGRFGVVGNIVGTVLKGDEECGSVDAELRVTVAEFNSALANFASRIGFRTFEVSTLTLDVSLRGLEMGMRNLEVGKQILEKVDGLRQNMLLNPNECIDGRGAAGEDKFIVPYQRNPHFKGRSDLLTELYNKLCETLHDQYNHRVALYGLGGVGKTQLALQYVHTHWQSKTYERVYWISAVNQASLLAGFQEIGVRTHCLPESKGLSPSEIGRSVLRWLHEQENYLLVIDNLDDVTVVEGLLPEPAPGRHTLITTRNQHCDHIPGEGLEVGVLDISQATELLLARAQIRCVGDTSDEKMEAVKIVKELGFLPLAIDQAAAYIREASHNIFEFLPGYRKDRKFYHSRTSKGNRTYPNPLATTWHLSFQQVQRNSYEAAELLRLLAFLNPDGVLIEFLERGKEGLTPELQTLVADRKRLYDALAELTRFSLVGRQYEGSPKITIHRLVQSIIQDDMSPQQYSSTTMTVIGLCDYGFPANWEWDTLESRQFGRTYQDQVLPALNAITSAKMGRLLGRVGMFFRADGNFQQARELLEKAIDIMEGVNSEQDSDTLCLMTHLAGVYRDQGKWGDAQKLEEKVLERRESVFGQENQETLIVMGNLALTYWIQGKWDDAEKLAEKVLELMKKVLGHEHPVTLTAMGNIATTYWTLGKQKAARDLREKVLELRKKVLGHEHPDTLTAMADLAVSYGDLRKWDDARKLEEKVLELRKKVLGDEHPETLSAMADLAVSFWDLRKFDDARKLEEKVLELRKKVSGDEHPETLMAMANLGCTYRDLGAISRSIELLEKAGNKEKRILGPDHPTTLRNEWYLALSYRMDGRLVDAIELLAETLDAQTRVLGKQHPDTIATATSLEQMSKEAQDAAETDEDFGGQEHSARLQDNGELHSDVNLE